MLFFAIFDTAGHELRAGLGTTLVMSAIRAARRAGAGLDAMARAADQALEEHLAGLRFTTAVLAELDLASGCQRFINAGHPQPLLIRHGKEVRSLVSGRRMPLGLDDLQVEIAEEMLERGDRPLLFTDGITEARDRTGELFGTERLIDLVQRTAGQRPAPEALRRLCHAALSQAESFIPRPCAHASRASRRGSCRTPRSAGRPSD
ncbi:PP2C family protein-serine/threonine phosphatase [Dactylosporangium sp. NPDC006015]|uniref:PP2C family protein-serine/threonine phosphatase n=1 Tax=Dactylosporangium sp. NPDC006015 TaxID=3154576 RepID=UPI0033A1B906